MRAFCARRRRARSNLFSQPQSLPCRWRVPLPRRGASKFAAPAARPVPGATALVRSIFALTRHRLVPQKVPRLDHAALRGQADVDLAWKYKEDSPRSGRIFQAKFREDRFFESGLARIRAGPRFHAPARARLQKCRPRKLPLPETLLPG